jgi:hypothetical protein
MAMNQHRADAKADWADPMKVTRSLAKLHGHPMESLLTRMLHGLVARHAPQNLHLLPDIPGGGMVFESEPAPVPVAFQEDVVLFGEIV